MSGTAAKITITEKQQANLQNIANAKTASVQHSQRAKIILLAFDRMLNMHIGEQLHLHPSQVGLWRRRWADSFDALTAIECRETNATLTSAIEQVLSDAPRSEYWLHSKEKCEETFQAQVQIVCRTYQDAPEMYFQGHTHTVSVDEMPGFRAGQLERAL